MANKKTITVVSVVLIALIGLSIGGFYFFGDDTSTTPGDQTPTTPSSMSFTFDDTVSGELPEGITRADELSCESKIIDEYKGKEKVLSQRDDTYNGRPKVNIDFEGIDAGTIKFDVAHKQIGLNDRILQVRGPNGALFYCTMYWRNNWKIVHESGVSYRGSWNQETWHHVEIKFRTSSNEAFGDLNQYQFSLTVDGTNFGTFSMKQQGDVNGISLYSAKWGTSKGYYDNIQIIPASS